MFHENASPIKQLQSYILKHSIIYPNEDDSRATLSLTTNQKVYADNWFPETNIHHSFAHREIKITTTQSRLAHQ